MIILAIFLSLLLQDAKQEPKQEKPADSRDTLRKMIVDFDKTYRKCAGRYNSSRTTADQQDAANENFTELNAWIRDQDETQIEFECFFVDIYRSEEDG